MLTSTNHRFVACRAYHQRLGSSSVVYRSVVPPRHRSTTLSLYCSVVLLLRHSTASSLRCSVPHCCGDRNVQSGERRLQSRDYRSVTLSLCGPAAPLLHRSAAVEVSCSVPHCCRDRSVQSGERRLQSRDYRAESEELSNCIVNRMLNKKPFCLILGQSAVSAPDNIIASDCWLTH